MFIISLLCFCKTMQAYDFCIDGLYYKKLSGNNISLTYNSSVGGTYSGVIDIPSEVDYEGSLYSVTEIGEKTFYKCTNLSSVNIPESVTTIKYNSFGYCKLNELTIPGTVILLEYDPMNFAEIGTLTLAAGKSNLKIQYTLRSSDTGYGSLGNCSITNLVINRNIERLKKDSSGSGYFYSSPFQGNKTIKSVRVADDVNFYVGANALSGCSGLTTVNLPESLTIIEGGTFQGCSSLLSVIMPNSITKIGSSAFYGCSALTSIIIPSSVSEIGGNAFQNCTSLKEIHSQNIAPPNVTLNTFYNVNKNQTLLYVPKGSKEYYAKATYWKDFVCIIEDSEDEETKTLKSRIEALESENATLKTQNSNLTKENAALKTELEDISSTPVYDLNGDKKVTITDVTTLIDIIVNK